MLVAGIFIYDLMTPLGYSARILYLIPLLLVSQMARPLLVYKAAGLFTLLMVITFTANQASVPILMGIHSPLLGGTALWIAAYLLERKRKAQEALWNSEERFRITVETLWNPFAILSPVRDGNGRDRRLPLRIHQ